MSYAAAVEPLRAANHLSGRMLYNWCHVSVDAARVKSSNGLVIEADVQLGDKLELDMLFVCAGGNPARFRHVRTINWLRKRALDGMPIGGMSGGSYILARAGVLDGYRTTIHWEHIPAFQEDFPSLDIRRTLYEIDRTRLTCAGGIASLDLMLALIECDHGTALANAVSEWFLRTQPRQGSGPQRISLRERYDVSNPKLLKALSIMARHCEDPLPCSIVAQNAGLSLRQLERLFNASLGVNPRNHYLTIRLEHARRLLQQTSMSVTQTAMASGFVSASHFTRAYRKKYATSPRQDRRHLIG
jgi:transcriptional regulator GlxA family with amidase domain